jgi:hypothetical protein
MNSNLKDLKQATTDICEMAVEARLTFKNAAVNWSDLRCTSAEYCVEDDCGDNGYWVLIEGAAPDNAELVDFIDDELSMKGYWGVEISLEW